MAVNVCKWKSIQNKIREELMHKKQQDIQMEYATVCEDTGI